MSKILISKEQAEQEFKNICEYWDIDIDNDDESITTKEKVVSAIMRGKLNFNEKEESFTYKLRKPLELANKEIINELTLFEPETQALLSLANQSDLQMSIRMIANSSKQPIGVIERLKMKDITILGSLMAFFV